MASPSKTKKKPAKKKEKLYWRNGSIHRKNVDGSISVLLLEDQKYYFTITGVAAELWAQFNGNHDLDTCIERVSKRLKLKPEEISKEAKRFVDRLFKLKLVEYC